LSTVPLGESAICMSAEAGGGRHWAVTTRLRAELVGLVTADVLFDVDALPGPGERTRARRVTVVGGSLVRSARVLRALGWEVTVHAPVGTDWAGEAVRAELSAAGVRLEATEAAASKVAAIFTGGLDRAIVSGPVLAPPHVDAELSDAELALSDGNANRAVLASTAAVRALDVANGQALPALHEVTGAVVVANHRVLAAMTGRRDPEAAVRHFLDAGVAAVAVTDGPGVVYAGAGTEQVRVALPAVAAVDTCGCGDVFTAAFAGALAAGAEVGDAASGAAAWASAHAAVWGNDALDEPPDALV
jgi:sugar/nucleoside kinase (ribokinase family)